MISSQTPDLSTLLMTQKTKRKRRGTGRKGRRVG